MHPHFQGGALLIGFSKDEGAERGTTRRDLVVVARKTQADWASKAIGHPAGEKFHLPLCPPSPLTSLLASQVALELDYLPPGLGRDYRCDAVLTPTPASQVWL